MKNIDKFMEIYEKEIVKRHEENPLSYVWPIEELPKVLINVRRHVVSGEFIKENPSMVATCKRLRINNTYKAISTYIHQTDVV